MVEQKQSTRNNSVIESLMLEDISVSDLTKESNNTLEENALKFTCNECNVVTTSKTRLDKHVKSTHLHDDDNEVTFVCVICKHEFSEVEDYDNHIKVHESISDEIDDDLVELQNIAFCHILENIAETLNVNTIKEKQENHMQVETL